MWRLRSIAIGCLAAGLLIDLGCTSDSRSGLPTGSPFSDPEARQSKGVPQGIATGDVTEHSALIWARTDGTELVQVEWWEAPASGPSLVPGLQAVTRTAAEPTSRAQDFTAKVLLTGLKPSTTYHYRVWTAPPEAMERFGEMARSSETGRFRTAPPPSQHRDVRFVWSGDLGGQGRCRAGEIGYPIFDEMRALEPQFMLFLGDTIYGDEQCEAPPNVYGSGFVATTVDEYRAKHRYQRGAVALRRFLTDIPVWVIWDDHEVRNNFSGPFDPHMPAGRQALLDYWPIHTPPDDPTRLHRILRYGADLELFILDTRQYRSRNQDSDGPAKTMLGAAQREWLIANVIKSTATWKVIATSVPLSNAKKGSPQIPGNDGWARGDDGTGFQHELITIIHSLLKQRVRNLVWLSGDVHYAAMFAYDPSGDGRPDFHEFIAGPLSARAGGLVPPPALFRPSQLYAETGFDNFGLVTANSQSFQVDIIDASGKVRHTHSVPAR